MAKRLIYADEIENLFYAQVEYGATDLMDAFDDALQDAPTVDAVEVVRCRDCKYWDDHSICEVHSEWPDQYNTGHSDYTEPDAFCSYGEHKGGQAPQREDV